MKMKNGGFSLIEMVIAVALVGVLSTLVVPKVREQLAKGKDAKAVATLTALRTASELYYVENEKSALEEAESEESIKKAMENLLPYLDSKAEAELKDGKVEIGGSKAGETEEEVKKAEIKYGGLHLQIQRELQKLKEMECTYGLNLLEMWDSMIQLERKNG